jgi:Peptidase_C39 like family/Transglycosylase SLT domain
MTRRDMIEAALVVGRGVGVDPVLLAALVDQESGLDDRAGAGAPSDEEGRGPLRLSYDIARWAGYEGTPEGLEGVGENLQAGARYLAYLFDRYGGDTRSVVAAFHAGPRAVDGGGWRAAEAYVREVEERMGRLRDEVGAVEQALPEPPPPFGPPPAKFPLPVPYVSQLERGPGGVQGYNNCGPACATMALLYNRLFGADPGIYHSVAADIRHSTWFAGTYTSFDQMIGAARQAGIPVRSLSSWPEVNDALDRRQPVLILVDNVALEPRQYDRSPGWNAHHFILLTGRTDDVFYVNDPLRYYGWPPGGPGQYTVASVQAAARGVGGVAALAIDRLPPDGTTGDVPSDGTTGDAGGDAEESLMPATDQELEQYLSQLGHSVNMDTAIIKRACLAYRRGETRGPAISDEYGAQTTDGRQVVRQKFTAGIAEYDPATGDVAWVEVVAHPDTVAS